MLEKQEQPRYCWKNMNLELARELVVGLNTSRAIRTAKELKSYTRYLLSFVVKVMRAAVPLHRSLSYSNP